MIVSDDQQPLLRIVCADRPQCESSCEECKAATRRRNELAEQWAAHRKQRRRRLRTWKSCSAPSRAAASRSARWKRRCAARPCYPPDSSWTASALSAKLSAGLCLKRSLTLILCPCGAYSRRNSKHHLLLANSKMKARRPTMAASRSQGHIAAWSLHNARMLSASASASGARSDGPPTRSRSDSLLRCVRDGALRVLPCALADLLSAWRSPPAYADLLPCSMRFPQLAPMTNLTILNLQDAPPLRKTLIYFLPNKRLTVPTNFQMTSTWMHRLGARRS